MCPVSFGGFLLLVALNVIHFKVQNELYSLPPRLTISAYLNNVHFNTSESKMTHSVKACRAQLWIEE